MNVIWRTALQVVLLELNEVNFDYLTTYAEIGHLPNLGRLIDLHGITKTISERRHNQLEPWIQWVSAHTGLTYHEHKVYRLGDIVAQDIEQIWEHLEAHGLRVGAISPMNAKNRTRAAEYFIPDPWTPTSFTGGVVARRLYSSVAQAVNDNAQSRVTLQTAIGLLLGLARYARPTNYRSYLEWVGTMRAKPWRKAMFLDLLLSDMLLREAHRTQPHFTSLFLNGAAHIQHHYMFNSIAYKGAQRNPAWYIAREEDPVGEVYRAYDQIVGQISRKFPRARMLIATGLHQDPHEQVTFYWRLKDHAAFLRRVGVPFKRLEPRMSRDFVVECHSESEAGNAQGVIESIRALDGTPLFEVDNRGQSLFVILTWPHNIDSDFVYVVAGAQYNGLCEDVAFVAIKNGEHNGIGYLVDTGRKASDAPAQIALTELPQVICGAFGVPWRRSALDGDEQTGLLGIQATGFQRIAH